jgi:hypothetical protein
MRYPPARRRPLSLVAALALLGQSCAIHVHIHRVVVADELSHSRTPSGPTTATPLPTPAGSAVVACAGARWFSDGSTGRSWAEARLVCQRMGGDLASIHSAQEQSCAESVLARVSTPAVGAWFGLREFDQEGAWRWGDGTSLTYTRWLQGEPNNDSGGPTDCAHLWRDQAHQWNDIPCSRTDPTYVCRLPP